jgi:acetolactate decarboxylase
MKILMPFVIYICLGVAASWAADIEVRNAGALSNFMHKGDLSAKFSLVELEGKEHVYALGAVEKLRGEIQIFDGIPANTYAENDGVVFDRTFQKKASLIVYAQIPAWNNIEIPSGIVSRSQFEKYLVDVARTQGYDLEQPLPFMLEGKAGLIAWHVINWDPEDQVHTHLKHINSGPHGTIESANVQVLGFYSNKHRAIFTHHSSDLHMHFQTNDKSLAGHVDDIELGGGMALRLPQR